MVLNTSNTTQEVIITEEKHSVESTNKLKHMKNMQPLASVKQTQVRYLKVTLTIQKNKKYTEI